MMADCPDCHGTRVIRYDENHGRTCDTCCPHPSDQRYTQGEHHPHPGAETCGDCGAEFLLASSPIE